MSPDPALRKLLLENHPASFLEDLSEKEIQKRVLLQKERERQLKDYAGGNFLCPHYLNNDGERFRKLSACRACSGVNLNCLDYQYHQNQRI